MEGPVAGRAHALRWASKGLASRSGCTSPGVEPWSGAMTWEVHPQPASQAFGGRTQTAGAWCGWVHAQGLGP